MLANNPEDINAILAKAENRISEVGIETPTEIPLSQTNVKGELGIVNPDPGLEKTIKVNKAGGITSTTIGSDRNLNLSQIQNIEKQRPLTRYEKDQKDYLLGLRLDEASLYKLNAQQRTIDTAARLAQGALETLPISGEAIAVGKTAKTVSDAINTGDPTELTIKITEEVIKNIKDVIIFIETTSIDRFSQEEIDRLKKVLKFLEKLND